MVRSGDGTALSPTPLNGFEPKRSLNRPRSLPAGRSEPLSGVDTCTRRRAGCGNGLACAGARDVIVSNVVVFSHCKLHAPIQHPGGGAVVVEQQRLQREALSSQPAWISSPPVRFRQQPRNCFPLPPNVSPASVLSRDVAKREAHHRLTCVLLHTRPFAASHVLRVVEKACESHVSALAWPPNA